MSTPHPLTLTFALSPQGMRIVHHGNDFYNMLESCRSEAMKSFSDDKVLLEKYIEKPRYVMVTGTSL